MSIFAFREMSCAPAGFTILRGIVKSTGFHCKVQVYPGFGGDGLDRIEYESHSLEEAKECDLKLTAKMITTFEAEGMHLRLFPLEIA